jgi:Transposase DDE domain
VVIQHNLNDNQKRKRTMVYFATETDLPGLKVLEYYHSRYQIEFNFRDAKGHLGLEDCQSRQPEALDFHFNHVLTTLNIAKAEHWLKVPKDQRGPFSMADIKTQYINELLLDQLILIYGKSPEMEKNNPKIRKLYQLGRIAA